MSALAERTEVLVVGAGPAGLVAGITLARYGINVQLVDKRDGVPVLSRAVVVSTRGMELMRRWGLEEAVRAGAPDVISRAWVTPDLASGKGTEMPLGSPTDEEAAAVSPCRPAWAPQDHHEPILLAQLRQMPTARVRFRCELTGLSQDQAGVHATLADRETGATRQIDARYIIGADGAHSWVRQELGIGMVGPDHLADYERVEFSAPLTEVACGRRYGLYVITRPDAASVLVQRGRGDRWGISRERTASQPRLEDLSEAELTTLIARVAGVDYLPVSIEGLSTFPFAAQIAERYRHNHGFIVGDAAHRMTPRGGTGMNTAIQDSFDLGWKLAWVLRGWAPASLLDSYEAERRPIGAHNVERSRQPGGARANASDALPWDLNGRLPHHWIRAHDRAISTIDLVGSGFTVLTGPSEPQWTNARSHHSRTVPVDVHVLDATAADALGLTPGGAMVLRPDGRETARWSEYDAKASPAALAGAAVQSAQPRQNVILLSTVVVSDTPLGFTVDNKITEQTSA
ncbi:MAG TPA: FAD-dependent monooxygenase [Streptosporangiaceae bacterium]|nr:FAD-dependent monooxygenase [Streptosporangiaceae bacterium]